VVAEEYAEELMNLNVKEMPEAQQTPAPLETYLDLDLSSTGSAARNLSDQITSEASEASRGEVHLSRIVGSNPAHMTPGMLEWYQTVVAPKRGLALASISSLFKERSERTKGEGFLLQTRLAALEENHLTGKLKCYKEHGEKHYTDYQTIERLEMSISENQYKYNVKKAELGRDAKVLNRPLYLAVMFFVLFGSEAALNLESFEALPWATPAIAWGATIVIGLAIGLAAHYHGTVFKQYGYWFGAAEDDNKRGPAWRMVLGGFLALLLSLAFVYYARSAYLVAYVGSLGGFGQSGSNYSTLWVIGGSLLGNMIVYLVGVLWAYLLHDSDPEFAELKKGLDQENKEVDALKRRLEHLRQRDVEQLSARLKKGTEETQRAYSLIMSQPNLAWPLGLFRKFQAKDQAVVALLQNYRGLLIQKMATTAKTANFVMYCDDPHVTTKAVSCSEFHMMAIKLKYLED
jgi:hypothetical protein